MRALFDVSTLLAVFDSSHMFHQRARAWWAENVSGGWASCPLTQNGFIRIMSQSGYPNPRALTAAMDVLQLAVIQPVHEFWSDDFSIIDPEVFDHSFILGPKQLTDVYLLALAVKHGGRLVTFDRGIPLRAVRHAEVRHIVVL
jgi:toxin-antitoxin system PIN domain toxin